MQGSTRQEARITRSEDQRTKLAASTIKASSHQIGLIPQVEVAGEVVSHTIR